MSSHPDETAELGFPLEVGWWRGIHAKRLSGHRMRHGELSRMKHRASGIPVSVEPVADKRVSDCGEVNPDLMSPPGLEVNGHERALRR